MEREKDWFDLDTPPKISNMATMDPNDKIQHNDSPEDTNGKEKINTPKPA